RVRPRGRLGGSKASNYGGGVRELRAAGGKGAGEALVFQVTNYLAGGCVSNAFIVRDGELWTPIARGEEGEEREGRRDGEEKKATEGRGGDGEEGIEAAGHQGIRSGVAVPS